MPDNRSAKAREYRQHYATARWRAVRLAQLQAEPLCRYCQERGMVTPAKVCHHIDPKTKDDPATFYSGPFASLCEPCHNGPAAREDNRGFSIAVGVDGYPIDPAHPSNRG
jgi:5-methylcytosine-specific restriction enzyme A